MFWDRRFPQRFYRLIGAKFGLACVIIKLAIGLGSRHCTRFARSGLTLDHNSISTSSIIQATRDAPRAPHYFHPVMAACHGFSWSECSKIWTKASGSAHGFASLRWLGFGMTRDLSKRAPQQFYTLIPPTFTMTTANISGVLALLPPSFLLRRKILSKNRQDTISQYLLPSLSLPDHPHS